MATGVLHCFRQCYMLSLSGSKLQQVLSHSWIPNDRDCVFLLDLCERNVAFQS